MIAALTGWQIVGSIVGATVVAAGWMICAVVVSREPTPDLHDGAAMGPRSLTSLNGGPFTVTEQPAGEAFPLRAALPAPPPRALPLGPDLTADELDARRRRRLRIVDDISKARPFDAGQDAPEIGGVS